jgi:alpha-tubulin suppressor-like RCC1 family protein
VTLCKIGVFLGVLGVTGVQISEAALPYVIQIACNWSITGEFQGTALRSDGTVWTWQIYPGLVPAQVSGLSNITAIAAAEGSSSHMLAVRNDGTVWAWGSNGSGQLGDGTTTDSSVPVQVSGLLNVVSVASGEYHSLAIKSDGTVWAWGSNWYGELGNGTSVSFPNVGSSVPLQVTGLYGVVAIVAGDCFSLAIRGDGTVWAWGCNSFGQLGNGTTTNSNIPVQVGGLSGITAIAAGDGHSLAVRSDGTVWAWGWNDVGQLGTNGTTNSETPLQVPGISNAFDVAGGGPSGDGALTSMVLTSNGTVMDWGYDAQSLSSLSNIVAIAGGGDAALAVRSDSTVWQWGMANSQLYAPAQVMVPAPASFQVQTSGTGPGAITPTSSTVYEGTNVTFTLTPSTGYTLYSVIDNGTGVTQGIAWNADETVYTYTISHVMSNHTVQVTFGNPFQLSYGSGGNGTITSSSSSADYGNSVLRPS